MAENENGDGIIKIVVENKKSPVEFSKNEKYIICSDTYKTISISHKLVKDSLAKAKLFIDEVNSIISNNSRKKQNERQHV